jgi:hypothetical protein
MDNQHYKYLAKGKVTMYGNSVKIEENTAGLTERQKRAINRERLKHQRVKKDPPKREKGDIKAFSKKARLRLLKKLNRFDFKAKGLPFFITLTYPQRYPEDSRTYKNDLDVFRKRLKRRFGDMEYIWRLEAQKRGAPHYHFIIYFEDRPSLGVLKEWVSKNWFEVVQRKWRKRDEKHLKAGTNCKEVDRYRQMVVYVSKYMTKVEQDSLLDQGRYWGASRNWGDKLASEPLEGRELIEFRRLVKRYISNSSKYMAQKVTKCANIELFLPQEFITNAYLWVKFGKQMMAESKPLLPG